MRFKEIYETCIDVDNMLGECWEILENCYADINCIGAGQFMSDEDRHKVNQFTSTYKLVYIDVSEKLDMIHYFDSTIFKMSEALNSNRVTRIADMMASFEELNEKIQCVIFLYQIVEVQNEKGIGLEIKIPDLKDITELKEYIDGLEFVFTKCPFFQSDDASLKLEAVDNGSIWLIFGVVCASVAVGSLLLNNIAAFIDKCFVIKSHKLTCEMQEQQIKNAKIEQKEKEELLKDIHRVYRLSVENTIR